MDAAFQFLRVACEVRDHIARFREAALWLDFDHLKVLNLDLVVIAMKIRTNFSLALARAIFPQVYFCRDDCVASAA